MIVVLGAIVLLSIVASLILQTPEQRAEARTRFARWNPLFIGFLIVAWTFILWPR